MEEEICHCFQCDWIDEIVTIHGTKETWDDVKLLEITNQGIVIKETEREGTGKLFIPWNTIHSIWKEDLKC